MFEFITKSGTHYYLEKVSKTFWGGQFQAPVKITSAEVTVGQRAKVVLTDGRTVDTSPVATISGGLTFIKM